MNKEIHVFPGGNTSYGFHSFYDNIISREEANKIYILKGGPGTGKSSLMKKIAEHYLKLGYSVEYHHCSSDNNSLDGVKIPLLKVAILDGTSPHVVDPKIPGAVDEIINLGQFWDSSKLTVNKEELIKLTDEIKILFNRAYTYFSAARYIHEDWSNLNSMSLNKALLYELQERLISKIPTKNKNKVGFERHLFLTAFTPNGIVTFTENHLKGFNDITVLNGGPGLHQTKLLNSVINHAIQNGYDVDVFNDPFIPSRIEHIFIPELSLAVICSNEINQKIFVKDFINLELLCDSSILNKNKDDILYDKSKFYDLIFKGLSFIKSAKSLHDKLEMYYIPAMDFQKYNQIYNMIIKNFDQFLTN